MTSVGVAGWDYPDWNGIVYPRGASRGFDRLAWAARFLDVVEINATFYRPVSPKIAASWIRRVAKHPGFRFTAKAHRSWTHEPWDDPPGSSPRPSTASPRCARRASWARSRSSSPSRSTLRLESTTRLGRLLDAAAGWPLVVEVRHISWDDDQAAAWMRERGAGWCVVDQPRSRTQSRPRPPARDRGDRLPATPRTQRSRLVRRRRRPGRSLRLSVHDGRRSVRWPRLRAAWGRRRRRST